jgi:hypothetical protein
MSDSAETSGKKLQQGSIVWATVPDPTGAPKTRPLVIITETNEIVLDAPIVGVAITATYPDPPPDTHIELPWHPRRHQATQLVKRSAAVCNWLVTLKASQVGEMKGFVPTKTMVDIVRKVTKLNT